MEYFDILDDNGSATGTAKRSECHSGSFLLHGVVHVLVFRTNGSLLLQKRSMQKDIQPGKWDTSVGGHINAGESKETALKRETSEELGIVGATFTPLYSYIMTSEIEREMVWSYSCAWDGPVIIQEDEIDEVREFSSDEITAKLGSGFFTPNFEDEWRYYRDWLEKNGA